MKAHAGYLVKSHIVFVVVAKVWRHLPSVKLQYADLPGFKGTSFQNRLNQSIHVLRGE